MVRLMSILVSESADCWPNGCLSSGASIPDILHRTFWRFWITSNVSPSSTRMTLAVAVGGWLIRSWAYVGGQNNIIHTQSKR